jgi:hypothetical protein
MPGVTGGSFWQGSSQFTNALLDTQLDLGVRADGGPEEVGRKSRGSGRGYPFRTHEAITSL